MRKNQSLQKKGLVKRIIKIQQLVTYEEIFSLTEDYPNDINIIINSDIFFDETIGKVHQIKRLEAYCLTRYDLVNGKGVFFNREDSQDAWVFRGHVKNVPAQFSQGRPGCDNRLAYELKKVGYDISNPSLDIHIIHLHESNKRTSVNTRFNQVQNPYALIFPHKLGTKAGILIKR